ncbi:MAG: HAD family hydrolase, partial [Pseudoflavonifractor sp.]
GTCRAQLQKVGAESFASRLTLEAKKSRPPRKSEMMRSLGKLIRVIGIALVPLGIALFVKQYFFLHQALTVSVTSTVAALIGMIPEGLYLLTSVALAVSVIRLARKKTLVHEMSGIETLARVDVLCVDKTGTITEPGMQVAGLVPLDEVCFPMARVEAVLGAFYTAAGADNETANTLRHTFGAQSDWVAERVIPFTSATKWSAASFGSNGAYAVGAPEFVLGQSYEPLRARVEEYSAGGERVLLLAALEGEPAPGRLPDAPAPVALIRLTNKIRSAAPAAFRYFAQQGVGIKVISGDNALAVSQVAQRAGIAGAERWVDAATLTTEKALAEAAATYTVFGRVTPDQKRGLIRALKT